jgi:hypothetical protein
MHAHIGSGPVKHRCIEPSGKWPVAVVYAQRRRVGGLGTSTTCAMSVGFDHASPPSLDLEKATSSMLFGEQSPKGPFGQCIQAR